MGEMDGAFQHDASFEPAEVGGNLRLGKFEAHYEEIFAEVIEDGVITKEERARLDRAAESLGLDRNRLRRLEQALQAAYEARHQIKIQDLSTPAAAPAAETAPASLTPLAADSTLHVQTLLRRIATLEGRIKDLERELEEARAHVAVEVDLSDVAPTVSTGSRAEELAELQRRVRHEPRDADAMHALFRLFAAPEDKDRRYGVAQALDYLGAAKPEEKAFYEAHRQKTLIRPTTSLTSDTWRRLLIHPEEEILTGEIFAVIVSAVLLGRVSALRRDHALPQLDPAQKQDPALSTIQAVRCFSWAAAILGMRSPTLYADPASPVIAEMVPGIPPSIRLGAGALRGRAPLELAFMAGRHLAWYREERFVRLLVPSIADLEDLFLAALHIGNPGIPLGADVKRRVLPIAQAIEPILEPLHVDRLRGYFLRFVEDGGRTNLQRWATAADRTAGRAGLLLSADLGAAEKVLKDESAREADERMNDLLVFVTSDRYAALRTQLGIALTP